MAKYKIILIHGVGKQLPGSWSTPMVDKLKKVSAQYAFFKEHPIENYADFIEITYDDLIEDVIKQWSTEADGVAKAVALQQVTAGKVLEVLKEGGDSESFYWDNVADVAIYRFFKTFRYAIRARVVAKLKDAILPYFNGGSEHKFMVIAHSMGTMVAHDAIYELMYASWDGAENVLKGKSFKFDSIVMLANTGRMLRTECPEQGMSIYESPVRPGGATFHYLNGNNMFDPITWPMSFRPNWTIPGFEQPVIKHLNLQEPWTVHNMELYLENPHIHIPILNRIVPYVITPEEMSRAYDDFKVHEPDLQNITGEFKTFLDSHFTKMTNESDVAQAIFSLADFIKRT